MINKMFFLNFIVSIDALNTSQSPAPAPASTVTITTENNEDEAKVTPKKRRDSESSVTISNLIRKCV